MSLISEAFLGEKHLATHFGSHRSVSLFFLYSAQEMAILFPRRVFCFFCESLDSFFPGEFAFKEDLHTPPVSRFRTCFLPLSAPQSNPAPLRAVLAPTPNGAARWMYPAPQGATGMRLGRVVVVGFYTNVRVLFIYLRHCLLLVPTDCPSPRTQQCASKGHNFLHCAGPPESCLSPPGLFVGSRPLGQLDWPCPLFLMHMHKGSRPPTSYLAQPDPQTLKFPRASPTDPDQQDFGGGV